MLIAQPDGMAFGKYDLLGIFSGIGAALTYTSIRELRRHYDTRVIVLSFMVVGTLGSLILMILSEYIHPQQLDFLLAQFIMPTDLPS